MNDNEKIIEELKAIRKEMTVSNRLKTLEMAMEAGVIKENDYRETLQNAMIELFGRVQSK